MYRTSNVDIIPVLPLIIHNTFVYFFRALNDFYDLYPQKHNVTLSVKVYLGSVIVDLIDVINFNWHNIKV